MRIIQEGNKSLWILDSLSASKGLWGGLHTDELQVHVWCVVRSCVVMKRQGTNGPQLPFVWPEDSTFKQKIDSSIVYHGGNSPHSGSPSDWVRNTSIQGMDRTCRFFWFGINNSRVQAMGYLKTLQCAKKSTVFFFFFPKDAARILLSVWESTQLNYHHWPWPLWILFGHCGEKRASIIHSGLEGSWQGLEGTLICWWSQITSRGEGNPVCHEGQGLDKQCEQCVYRYANKHAN